MKLSESTTALLNGIADGGWEDYDGNPVPGKEVAWLLTLPERVERLGKAHRTEVRVIQATANADARRLYVRRVERACSVLGIDAGTFFKAMGVGP